jgi:hypothetical protein
MDLWGYSQSVCPCNEFGVRLEQLASLIIIFDTFFSHDGVVCPRRLDGRRWYRIMGGFAQLSTLAVGGKE